VPLAAISDPALVLLTIARELGLRELDTRSPAALIARELRHRQLLLVLDNFEQVRSAATDIVELLAACPGVTALVTSRELLRVAGEQRFPVTPLDLPPPVTNTDDPNGVPLDAIAASAAVRLFVARAQAVDPGLQLDTTNAPAIAAICRQLDGLPLAIELAAARSHHLAPDDLLARLHPTLSLLTSGPEDAPDRLRTMRDAIAWSYHLLAPDEQTLFRRLAVFAGGFTLDAAEWVTEVGSRESEAGSKPTSANSFDSSPSTTHPAPSPDTLDLIGSLVDKSLVSRTESHGGARFRMLETIREFGLEQLAQSGEAEAVAARHAAWCIALAKDTRQSGKLSRSSGLLALEAEHPNLRAALGWLLACGHVTRALNLAGLLAEFWFRHGHLSEGRAWLERALAAGNEEATAARAEALVGLSLLLWLRGEFAHANLLLAEAERLARAAGDAGVLAYARLHQGYVAIYTGDFDLAVARGEEALEGYKVIPQAFSLHGALWLLARAPLERGEDDRAAALFERLLASARALGDEISVTNGLEGLAILAERRGDREQALSGFAEAALVCQGYGDRVHASLCLERVAGCATELGHPEPAVRLFAAAESLRAAVGAQARFLVDGRAQHDRTWAEARATLGEARFVAAWAAGANLTLDEAIAEAAALVALVLPASSDPIASDALTERERDVLRLLVRGWSDKEIAAELGVGRRTVSSHVAAIRAKLDAPSRSAATAIAVRDRLV
jgi:non-specific serine/threonine protein kinase